MEYFHNTRVIGFNPHTHAGCDIARCHFFIFKKVSIHTPTQGVTREPNLFKMPVCRFNPHTHAGCDVVKKRLHNKSQVSIHTPTQGVTDFRTILPRCQQGFNPHTHAGCDYIVVMYQCAIKSFNPHTHAGCDLGWEERFPKIHVSIHTPTQGVTM